VARSGPDPEVLARSEGLPAPSDPAKQGCPAAEIACIFTLEPAFVTLDRLVVQLHKKRCELLTVPDHPRIPLHTSGLENAVPRQVSQRKVGGGRDRDRNRRDRLLDLAKAGDKLKVLFWDCLGVGPAVPGRQALPPASELTFTGARSP
jgi:hypothetical protein